MCVSPIPASGPLHVWLLGASPFCYLHADSFNSRPCRGATSSGSFLNISVCRIPPPHFLFSWTMSFFFNFYFIFLRPKHFILGYSQSAMLDRAGTQLYVCVDDVICLHRMIVAEPGCERTHRSINQRQEESFYSLSKRGKGPGAQSGMGPEGWLVESFIEFKRKGAGKMGWVHICFLAHSCSQPGCTSVWCVFLENGIAVFNKFQIWKRLECDPWQHYPILNHITWTCMGDLHNLSFLVCEMGS